MRAIQDATDILGFPVFNAGLDRLLDDVEAAVASSGQCRWAACFNPHSYAASRSSPVYREALTSADWLLPDGVGVVWAGHFLGRKLAGRVTGPDLFMSLNKRLNVRGGARLFFLGSTPQTLEDIERRMAAEYPNLSIVGTYSPPFKPEFDEFETRHMVDAINRVQPDVLWVGMTSPKQDVWIRGNLGSLKVPFAAGVGAVFDFFTGRVRRPHPVVRKLGLEWLTRLVQEPRRLWRRTFISGPIFVADVVAARLRPSAPGRA